MKRIVTLALALAAVSVVAAGCGSAAPTVKDGTYRAEISDEAAEAAHGWKDFLEVTYQDGKITAVDFDAVNSSGARKSEATPEEYPMPLSPAEWVPQLDENIKAAKKSSEIDTVTGATNSSDSARKLMAAIEANAAKGNTETVVVE